MMYITVQKNAPHGEKRELYWHVRELKPYREMGETVIDIQADGDELDYIHDFFTNLPSRPKARVVVWLAPFAQFIYDNL